MDNFGVIFWILLAIGIIYYLYISMKDYLKNPLNDERSSAQNINNAISPTQEAEEEIVDPLQKSDYGIAVMILGLLSSKDTSGSVFASVFVNFIIGNMATDLEIRGKGKSEELKTRLFNLYNNPPFTNIDNLAEAYKDATAGEYKKKLKLIEIMFALSYTNSVLQDGEKETIITTAALLGIDNDDFNAMYDNFEAISLAPMGEAQAAAVLKIANTSDKMELQKALNTALSSLQDGDITANRLGQIAKAYEILDK